MWVLDGIDEISMSTVLNFFAIKQLVYRSIILFLAEVASAVIFHIHSHSAVPKEKRITMDIIQDMAVFSFGSSMFEEKS